MNRAPSFLAATFAASLAVSAPCFAAVAPSIGFTIERSGMPDRVQLRLDARFRGNHTSNWSNAYRLQELQGLTSAQLSSPSTAPVRFALVREAGRIDCGGEVRAATGRGTCRFTPDAHFAALLAGRGSGRPTLKQSYAMTMGGAGRAGLDALAVAKYPLATVDQMVAFAIHNVTPAYIRGLADAGYRLGAVDDLVGFRIHRVSPELIAAYRTLGYRQLSADNLMAMAIHRVTPEFIRGFARLGYRNLSADKLVQLRIFNVTPDDVRALQAQGVALPSADQLVRLRLAGFSSKRRR